MLDRLITSFLKKNYKYFNLKIVYVINESLQLNYIQQHLLYKWWLKGMQERLHLGHFLH